MIDQKHQGWANHETAHVASWIDQDETHRHTFASIAADVKERTRYTEDTENALDEDAAFEAESEQAKMLKLEFTEAIEDFILGDSGTPQLTLSLIRSALSRVNWYEIYESLLSSTTARLATATHRQPWRRLPRAVVQPVSQ